MKYQLFADRRNEYIKMFLLFLSCTLAGFLGGQISKNFDFPQNGIVCKGLKIVDSSGNPVIDLASTNAGPEINLVGKDGVQSLSLRVVDTPNSGDNRMSQISFRHSELNEDQITLGALRDKSSNMFLGSHDSYGSIYMSAAPAGHSPSSSFSVGYFSGPRMDCFANNNKVELTVGQGKTCIRASKFVDSSPSLEIQNGDKKSTIK